MNPIRRFDPREHLAAAIGWTVFLIVTAISFAAADAAADATERRARADVERLMTQFATEISHALEMNLRTRLSIVQATAAQIGVSRELGAAALRRHLEAVQSQFPEFAWVGLADASGRVVTATGGVLQGEDASSSPWFLRGRAQPYLGEVHAAAPLEQALSGSPDGQARRFVDAAAPVAPGADGRAGVLGAAVSWTWIDGLQDELLRTLDTHRRLELLLAARDGTILVGPPAWRGRSLATGADLGERGAYLSGRHAELSGSQIVLPWTVVVRQSAATALAPARATSWIVFGVVAASGLASALAAVAVTRILTRRLGVLARDARAVQRGESESLAPLAGRDEVSDIGAAMSGLVAHLQREKRALARLNAELDQRVAERTARIERLAEDSRHAAVTRERLRLARDMHDTLAHSLMALLTQIRLVRKLGARMTREEFDGELQRAEEVAANGLENARAAIAQMRQNGVREAGLSAALGELLARFGERTGVAATLRADASAGEMADERAETVFRIVEEALRNVERHAQARSVRVDLESLPGSVGGGVDARMRVVVTDDGVGFDSAASYPGHYGLVGMREQAALVGATLQVKSAPGQGTSIGLEFAA